MSRPAILDALAVADLAVALCDDATERIHRARHETDDEALREDLVDAADDLSQAWLYANRSRSLLRQLARVLLPAPAPAHAPTPLDVARRAGWVE
ncbi:hypothetical protein [Sanguibacter massiliensis]|uniref:hypothetical protein n=1 Tax=Sanguibacter massiliensis TaxID=1973217 RepID=UPI000C860EEE|nr:hypothetical protein [Sanguibacter massiliensis]